MQATQDMENNVPREDVAFCGGFWVGTRVATNPLAFDTNGQLVMTNLNQILKKARYMEFRPWNDRDERRLRLLRQLRLSAAMYQFYGAETNEPLLAPHHRGRYGPLPPTNSSSEH